jgi:tRNA U55 pseudouridine synthase TruB
LHTLRRTRFGAFDLTTAVELASWNPQVSSGVLSIRQALGHLPALVVDRQTTVAVRRGQKRVLEELASSLTGNETVLTDDEGEVVAVLVKRDGRWQFGRVL